MNVFMCSPWICLAASQVPASDRATLFFIVCPATAKATSSQVKEKQQENQYWKQTVNKKFSNEYFLTRLGRIAVCVISTS